MTKTGSSDSEAKSIRIAKVARAIQMDPAYRTYEDQTATLLAKNYDAVNGFFGKLQEAYSEESTGRQESPTSWPKQELFLNQLDRVISDTIQILRSSHAPESLKEMHHEYLRYFSECEKYTARHRAFLRALVGLRELQSGLEAKGVFVNLPGLLLHSIKVKIALRRSLASMKFITERRDCINGFFVEKAEGALKAAMGSARGELNPP